MIQTNDHNPYYTVKRRRNPSLVAGKLVLDLVAHALLLLSTALVLVDGGGTGADTRIFGVLSRVGLLLVLHDADVVIRRQVLAGGRLRLGQRVVGDGVRVDSAGLGAGGHVWCLVRCLLVIGCAW